MEITKDNITAHRIINKWDEGQTVWTIEMGGLGPAYEQALQIAAIEATREIVAYLNNGGKLWLPDENNPMPEQDEKTLNDLTNTGFRRVEGLSGAQAGAANSLAIQWLLHGEEGLQEIAKEEGLDDRRIMISKAWPKAKIEGEQP